MSNVCVNYRPLYLMAAGRLVKELTDYWRTAYDWRQHERAINTFRHYRVTIDGQPIHFLHEPGTGPKPMPSAPFSRPCLFSRFP